VEQSTADILQQRDIVNQAFHKKIEDTIHAKKILENEHKQVRLKIVVLSTLVTIYLPTAIICYDYTLVIIFIFQLLYYLAFKKKNFYIGNG